MENARSANLRFVRGTIYSLHDSQRGPRWIRYDSVYLTCSKKLTGSQLSLPHGTNKKLKCKSGVKWWRLAEVSQYSVSRRSSNCCVVDEKAELRPVTCSAIGNQCTECSCRRLELMCKTSYVNKNITNEKRNWPVASWTVASYHRCYQRNRRRLLTTDTDARTQLITPAVTVRRPSSFVDNSCGLARRTRSRISIWGYF